MAVVCRCGWRGHAAGAEAAAIEGSRDRGRGGGGAAVEVEAEVKDERREMAAEATFAITAALRD